MRIVIDDQVFKTPDLPALLSIFYWGMIGRHRILVEPFEGTSYRSWLASLDDDTSFACESVVKQGERLEASEPAAHELLVTLSTDLAREPPALRLQEAAEFAALPYRLVLENSHYDALFLKCLCTPLERRYLEQFTSKEWLELDNGGGLGGVARWIETLREMPALSLFKRRVSVLFDPDAIAPGSPSTDSLNVASICATVNVHYYVLKRRAIENYVPISSLLEWSRDASGKEGRKRRRKVRALIRLSQGQRDHYHVKRGLAVDTKDGVLHSHFKLIPEQDKAFLQKGLGRGISDLYDGKVHEKDLRKSGAWDELRPFVRALIARIR